MVLSFIESNWLGGNKQITDSYDTISTPIDTAGLLDFKIEPRLTPVILDRRRAKLSRRRA